MAVRRTRPPQPLAPHGIPGHRDTYDAMFDLWFPAALGSKTVLDDVDEDGEPDGLPPEDVEAMRAALLDLLADNPELENLDERLAAMIAQIVEAYGRYS